MQGERIAEINASKGLLPGGPTEIFEPMGRHQFIKLIEEGLLPESKVLDIGCGCLRGGYWLINFLRPGNYYGIEPTKPHLEVGLDVLFDNEILEEKKPNFSHNADFDLTVFDERFDFLIARSIWSHASLEQIDKMLDGFISQTGDNGVFLTSYVKVYQESAEYKGSEFSWPAIGYMPKTLRNLIQDRGLHVEDQEFVSHQFWLKISKKPSHQS